MGTVALTSVVQSIVTLTPAITDYRGVFRAVRATLTGSAAYATNGDTLPSLPFGTVDGVWIISGTTPNADGNVPNWDRTAQKLKFVSGAGNTEVANATDLSGASWDVLIIGR